MKLVVFAHRPPPFHGQSLMVGLMLDALAEPGSGVEAHHVDARFSDGIADVGSERPGKLGALVRHVAAAIRLRWATGAEALYYVPAPAKRSAIARDLLVMAALRPFFPRLILHWHAMGLGAWVRGEAGAPRCFGGGGAERLARGLVRRALGGAAVGIALAEFNRADAAEFEPRQLAIVPNGIDDPCPDFESVVLGERRERWSARASGGASVFEVLFLAHCTREKGLFDAVRAVREANARLGAAGAGYRMRLTVAGAFVDAEEEREFRELIAGAGEAVRYAGFVEGAEKDRLLRGSDALCFPSTFPNEAQPVSLIEALAYGLPPVVTRWRGLPEMMPPGYPFIVPPGDFGALAEALIGVAGEEGFERLRARYIERHTRAAFARALRSAFEGA